MLNTFSLTINAHNAALLHFSFYYLYYLKSLYWNDSLQNVYDVLFMYYLQLFILFYPFVLFNFMFLTNFLFVCGRPWTK